MRALELHDLDSRLTGGRQPVVLDSAYLGRLNFLASQPVHGAWRLARFLREEQPRATILPSDWMPADVVNVGSDVTYRDEVTGDAYRVTLVLPHEADIWSRRVSVLTPVGTALIGRREGAVVDCEFPVGRIRQLSLLRVAQPAPAQLAARASGATPPAHGAPA
jgi:regulator of nucleoside diphosphate kinase